MPVTVCAQHQGLSLVALNGVSLRKKGTLLMGFIAYESVAGAPVTTDAAGARVSSPASRTTRGKDHPTACLSGLGAGQAYRPGCVGFWAVFRCYKAERWGLDSL